MVEVDEPEIVEAPVNINPDNLPETEKLAYKYLVQHFQPYQVVGILGNLKQESGFNTEDHPNGLGIAQWLGARRQNLIDKYSGSPSTYQIYNQLQYIVEEMNGTEKRAGDALRASQTLEEATQVFQDQYERCGDCRASQRLTYAQEYWGLLIR